MLTPVVAAQQRLGQGDGGAAGKLLRRHLRAVACQILDL